MPLKIIGINHVPGTKVCVVDPVSVDTAAGDTIKWRNNTADEVIVLFPHNAVLDHNAKKWFHKDIAPGDSYPPAPSGANVAKKGQSFRYAVFCRQTGNFAVGGSDPEIIVT